MKKKVVYIDPYIQHYWCFSLLCVDPNFHLVSFHFCLKSFLNFSCSKDLLAIMFFSFLFFWKIILFQFLIYLLGKEFCQIFFFQYFKDVSPFFFWLALFLEKSAIISILSPLCVFFNLAAFNVFKLLLLLVFSNFDCAVSWHNSLYFFQPRVRWASWICRFIIFINFGNF